MSGKARISRSVIASWRKPVRDRTASGSRTGRLRSRETVKTVKPPHHRPAVARQMRTASPVVRPSDVAPSTSAQVDGEQQRPADVAERPAPAGDGVAVVGAGQIGQPRVVDDGGRAEADVGDDEQDATEQPSAVADEEQRGGDERAEEGEPGQHLPACVPSGRRSPR